MKIFLFAVIGLILSGLIPTGSISFAQESGEFSRNRVEISLAQKAGNARFDAQCKGGFGVVNQRLKAVTDSLQLSSSEWTAKLSYKKGMFEDSEVTECVAEVKVNSPKFVLALGIYEAANEDDQNALSNALAKNTHGLFYISKNISDGIAGSKMYTILTYEILPL